MKLTPVQLIVLYYFIGLSIATLLLSLPIAHQPGVELSFIDALFTAASAISVTGLTTVSTADTFSVAGVFILVLVLQIGGIGIMTIGTIIWIIMGKRIGLRDRQLIMVDHNQYSLSGMVKLMRGIIGLILFIEAMGAVILGFYFLNYYDTWQAAFYHGLFASVSATTNAGFDITGQSLVPYAHDYFVQIIHMVLIILGAIGFPVLIEVKEYFAHYRQGKRYRFSLFTKLTSMTYFLLAGLSILVIYVLEHNRFLADKSWHESLFYTLFQAITTRSCGLSTMDVGEFDMSTQMVMSILMFIGASPSSVGGGIRTTTFIVIVLAVFFFAKGKDALVVFGREIVSSDIHKAFVVLSTAVILCGGATVMMLALEPFPIMEILFEVSSAFGTTGLSLGITSELSVPGKLLIMLLMFIGRIGLLSFLFMMRGKVEKSLYHYPKEKVIIG